MALNETQASCAGPWQTQGSSDIAQASRAVVEPSREGPPGRTNGSGASRGDDRASHEPSVASRQAWVASREARRASREDVIVVGGGLAGLAAACYLARGGRSATVLDKARSVGGRALTDTPHGYALNR